MKQSNSDLHKAENEVIFREYNEQVQKGYDQLRRIATEDKQHLDDSDDSPLQFYCECSDENCRKRITMKPSVYNDIHIERNVFVILSGHEVTNIERVIQTKPEYEVVRKFFTPPQEASKLNPTDVNNT